MENKEDLILALFIFTQLGLFAQCLTYVIYSSLLSIFLSWSG